jgi:hypothetical protein
MLNAAFIEKTMTICLSLINETLAKIIPANLLESGLVERG